MWRSIVVGVALALSAGCDRLNDLTMRMAGWETIVLESHPFELRAQERQFLSQAALTSRGEVSVCVVLKTDAGEQPPPFRSAEFEALMKGAVLTATLESEAGRVYSLGLPSQAWKLNGVVSDGPELAACVSNGDEASIPEGEVIRTVQIRSDRPLTVLGVYWQSEPPSGGPNG